VTGVTGVRDVRGTILYYIRKASRISLPLGVWACCWGKPSPE
jgi:hypothetical protein